MGVNTRRLPERAIQELNLELADMHMNDSFVRDLVFYKFKDNDALVLTNYDIRVGGDPECDPDLSKKDLWLLWITGRCNNIKFSKFIMISNEFMQYAEDGLLKVVFTEYLTEFDEEMRRKTNNPL